MKKIISALTLGAMVAGAAFADVSIALNYRQRANLLSHSWASQNWTFSDEKGGDHIISGDARTQILGLDAYSGNGTDNLSIGLSGDIVAFNAQLVTDQAKENEIRSKSFNGNLNLGKLQAFAGVWADGKVNGAFRNKTDIDAGNMEGMDFEFKKLGSAFGSSPAFFVDNIVQPVDGKGESYALGAQYTLPGTKSFKWYAQAAYITNSTTEEKSHGKSNMLKGHSLTGLINFRVPVGTGEVVFKYGDYNKADKDKNPLTAMAFGAYFMPVTIDNLTTSVGASGAMVGGTFTDWNADLRLHYKAGKVSFSSFHSFSQIVANADDCSYLGLSNKSTKGLANYPTTSYDKDKDKWKDDIGVGKHGGTPISRDMILTNNLMVRAKFNKSLAMYGFVADMIGMGKNLGKDLKDYNGNDTTKPIIQLRTGLYGQVYCGSNSISMGVVYSMHDVTKTYTESGYALLSVPVIFRVKM